MLLHVARDALAHAESGSLRTEAAIMELGASLYTDAGRFEREQRLLFRRVPLMLAASCELREPGQFKTLEVAGVPVLLSRGDDGQARAFLNVCTHRGAVLADGCGHSPRFVCPYHGWTFDGQGALVGVAARRDFGEFDLKQRGLRQFPLLERAGLIWVILDPDSTLNIDGFLSMFGDMLEGFGFESWHFLQRRTLKGANWKLAFDAHLEFYHLPVLHRNTFGPKIGNRALYHYFGPHQRLVRPSARKSRNLAEHVDLFDLQQRPEVEWPTEALMLGEWIAFPNVSINSFYDGGRGVLISQIFPGERVDESFTVQTYLMAEPPDDTARTAAAALCDFLGHVVNDEDLATSIRQQRALASGLLPSVCIGRNEGGLQHFHRWIDRVLDAPDHLLIDLFAADTAVGRPVAERGAR
jgi:carnitine monooxygenase subunit